MCLGNWFKIRKKTMEAAEEYAKQEAERTKKLVDEWCDKNPGEAEWIKELEPELLSNPEFIQEIQAKTMLTFRESDFSPSPYNYVILGRGDNFWYGCCHTLEEVNKTIENIMTNPHQYADKYENNRRDEAPESLVILKVSHRTAS